MKQEQEKIITSDDELKNKTDDFKLVAIANRICESEPDLLNAQTENLKTQMFEFIEKDKIFSHQELKAFLLNLTKVLSIKKGLDIDVNLEYLYKDYSDGNYPLATHHYGEGVNVSEISINASDGIFSGFKTYQCFLNDKKPDGEAFLREDRVYGLAIVIHMILHELRHEEQEIIMKDETNLDATRLVMIEELFIKNKKLYNNFHDAFLIEKDADFSAYVLTPMYFKSFCPFLNNEETNVLDPHGIQQKRLKERIKIHKNTTWEILYSRVFIGQKAFLSQQRIEKRIGIGETPKKRPFDEFIRKNIGIFGTRLSDCLSVGGQSDSCNLDSDEIDYKVSELLKKFPQLNYFYNKNGMLRSYGSLLELKDKKLKEIDSKYSNSAFSIKRKFQVLTMFEAIIRSVPDYQIVSNLISAVYGCGEDCKANQELDVAVARLNDQKPKDRPRIINHIKNYIGYIKAGDKLTQSEFKDTFFAYRMGENLDSKSFLNSAVARAIKSNECATEIEIKSQ